MTDLQSSIEVLKVDVAGRVITPKEKREELVEAVSVMRGTSFSTTRGSRSLWVMTTTEDTRIEVLKQDRIGRVRTPRVLQEAILEEYDRSGMSGQGFAKLHGIKYQTFATWVQKRRRRTAGGLTVSTPPVKWVEAEVGRSETMRSGGAGLVVEFGRGMLLRVGDDREAKLAAALLGHLGVGRC